tara:strand:- start:102 stop:734 length:633 start_codon:yes stop_codon:yes gene_type:complete
MSRKKPVRCVETGEVFDSLTAAGWFIGSSPRKGADNHGVLHSHVSHAANGHAGAKTAGGYHWEFIHNDSKVSSIIPQEKVEDSLPRIYKAIGRKAPKQPKVDYPPEGYVYIFRNRWHPENVYKIGSTDNLEGRRSAARTWGPYKCEYYLEVADCKRVEADVHERLSSYKISSDDLGQEHFTIDLKVAIKTIELANSHDSLRRILDSALAA